MKISRTLKRLRNEKGITQDDLAKLLFISRQSVSSWENDRTQPDIDMLVKLSEIFDVSIEELIYGKKRNTELETEKPNHTSTLITVFSILGCLLAGSGLILIFITFWEKMPDISKAVLSFLPVLAGQAAGIFVLMKKRNSIPWCEGAGTLWTAGIAGTLTLIYNIFSMNIEWHTVLILISLSVFPIVLLLKCISPLAIFYGCAIPWCLTANEKNIYINLCITVLLLIAGCVFSSYKVKKESKSVQGIFSQWISAVAVVAFAAILGAYLDGSLSLSVISMGAAGICLLMISLKNEDISIPYKIPGLLLTTVAICTAPILYVSQRPAAKIEIVFLSACLAAILLTAVFVRPKTRDVFFILYLLTSTLVLVTLSIHLSFGRKRFDNPEIFTIVMLLLSVIASILLMISGAKQKKLLPINAGFIGIAVISTIFVNKSGFSMLTNGIILLIFGFVLLAINVKLSSQNKKTPAAAITEEVPDNE